MKKLLCLVIAIILVFNTVPVFGAPLSYEKAGEILKNLGILEGSETGDLMLYNNLKREEMVVLISRLYGEEDMASKYPVKDTFMDIKNDSRGNFYKPYIYWAADKGLIKGTSSNTFGYERNTTVQELQTVLLRALDYGSEVNESYGAVPKLAESKGIMNGLSINKDDTVTRGLMAIMTLNALKANIKGHTNYTLADKLNLSIPNY